jgi:hypothetical protein
MGNSQPLTVAVSASRALADLVEPWLAAGSDGEPPSRRPAKVPSDFHGHLLALLTAAKEAFGVTISCAQDGPLVGLISSYRFLAESLVTARWLTEPDADGVRAERANSLTVAALTRLTKMAAEAEKVPAFENLTADIKRLQRLIEKRLAGDASTAGSVPRRPELIRRLLPGGYAIFAALSEFVSHPGPLATVLLGEHESDRLFWLSVAYATFVSIAGEVAIGLGRDDWIDTLERAIDNADPIIAVAWPPELHPRGPA